MLLVVELIHAGALENPAKDSMIAGAGHAQDFCPHLLRVPSGTCELQSNSWKAGPLTQGVFVWGLHYGPSKLLI